MNIVQNLVNTGKYSIKCPYPMTPTRYVVHNTSNDATAANEVSYMIGNNNQVSFHYAVDDTQVVQGIPENRNAFHAGDGASGTGNRQGIGVEICYSKSGGAKFTKAEQNAAKFIAQGLKAKGWGVNKVTKHQDYSGKYCPHRTLDLGWQRFLNMIQAELNALNAPVKSKDFEAHVQNIGWQGAVQLGEVAGSTGKGLRLEAFRIFLAAFKWAKVHIQNKGWVTFEGVGTICGTIGQSLRAECIIMNLPGYEFRVHQQNVGWTTWTLCDGISSLGSVGQSLRIEAIQIRKKA